MELVKLESTLPLKAYPKEKLKEVIFKEFIFWISDLLSLTDEVSAKRLYNAIPAIETHCWSMGFSEIKKMFEMYADNKLSIEPIPNYFDRILFGKIASAYNKQKKVVTYNEKSHDEMKDDKDFLYVIQCFDFFIQSNYVPQESVWIYDYLETKKGILSVSNDVKKELHAIYLDELEDNKKATIKAKLVLLGRYFTSLKTKGKHIKELI